MSWISAGYFAIRYSLFCGSKFQGSEKFWLRLSYLGNDLTHSVASLQKRHELSLREGAGGLCLVLGCFYWGIALLSQIRIKVSPECQAINVTIKDKIIDSFRFFGSVC